MNDTTILSHLPTSCAILPWVSAYRAVMEGSGLGSAGCVVHVGVHALRVSCVVDCYNAIATEHGRNALSCIHKLWSAQAVQNLYGMLESKVCHGIVLLLNVADILYVLVRKLSCDGKSNQTRIACSGS